MLNREITVLICVASSLGGKSTRNLRPFAAASPEQWQAGVVKATARYGAFVTVSLDDNTADGLVPIQDTLHVHIFSLVLLGQNPKSFHKDAAQR